MSSRTDTTRQDEQGGQLAQSVLAGVVTALVGFTSAFAVVLTGLTTVGASPSEAASGLFVVTEGQQLAEGETVVVIEAMKMEQPLKAHKAGTVTGLQAEVGATVTNGAVICEIKD